MKHWKPVIILTEIIVGLGLLALFTSNIAYIHYMAHQPYPQPTPQPPQQINLEDTIPSPVLVDNSEPLLAEVKGYGELSISPSYTYKNMSLFVIYRAAQESASPYDFITLQEGLESKQVIVSEKEDATIRTLQVENLSDRQLFIQIGDILKGGKQDRTIQASLIIPPHTGKIDVPSLCVEQGRWGTDSSNAPNTLPPESSVSSAAPTNTPSHESTASSGVTRAFYYSGNCANGNVIRSAIQGGDQGLVWQSISTYNAQLYTVNGFTVNGTSLNSMMDNEKLKVICKKYQDAYGKLLEQYPQGIGLAYVLHGKLQTIELFQSPELLRKSFGKLVYSFATEAAINTTSEQVKILANTAVKDFLFQMEEFEEAKVEFIMENETGRYKNEVGLISEVKNKGTVIHRQYLKK
jgi:hypothetical protein